MKADLKVVLKSEIEILEKAGNVLKHSLDKCSNIKVKETYSEEEMDLLELLTARFARLSDILIQKILRLLDEIELESSGTVRDRINRAAKKGAVINAEKLIEIRVLRNQIAHEYLPEEVVLIFGKVLESAPLLLNDCELAQKYALRILN